VAIPVRIPSWARELIADLQLDPAQWPDFTDFGFAAVDSDGRVMEKEPANYSRTRLTVELPERPDESTIRLVLAPGFADPGSRARWKARVRIRLIAEQPEVLPAREGDAFQIAPGAAAEFHARLGPHGWPIPPGFAPLLLALVESGGNAWTWQLPLIP
ncbi:MAG TPA: hypothetical protein VI383_08535, partial [Gemmatimonadales bacterium]|nr:hypothetical protein [Gemmatimonadales bacterium]